MTAKEIQRVLQTLYREGEITRDGTITPARREREMDSRGGRKGPKVARRGARCV
ncbi:MAG TPA: hypothetical protein VJ810_10650 [Blastocatellia bacterium]|nr:hypothetical protein [Blastocatellia bacterium]